MHVHLLERREALLGVGLADKAEAMLLLCMIPSAHPFRHPNLCTQRLAYALKSSGPDCNCFLDPDQVMFVLVGWSWTPEPSCPDAHLPSLVRLAIRGPNSQCGELRIEVTTHLQTESTTF